MIVTMDNLLCRAKRKSDGVWVYGFYVEGVCGESFILQGFISKRDNAPEIVLDRSLVDEVDTDTVCRSVGIKSKSGEPIFEGDILSSKYDEEFPEMESVVYVKWLLGNGFGWYTTDGRYDPDPITKWDDGYWSIQGNIFVDRKLAHEMAADVK